MAGDGVFPAAPEGRDGWAVLDALPDPLLLLRPVRDASGNVTDMIILAANHAMSSAVPAPASTYLGKHLLEVFPDRADVFAHARQVADSGRSLKLDGHEVDGPEGGTRRTLAVRVVPVGSDVCATWRDVTMHVDALEAVREAEQRSRMLAENAADVVLMRDAEGRVQWISPSVESLLGWSAEELLGTDVLDVVHPHDRPLGEAARSALSSGAGSEAAVVRIRTKDGGFRHMSVVSRRLTEGGLYAGASIGLRDVDAQVRAQQSAQEAAELWQGTLDAMLDPHALLYSVRDQSGRLVDFRIAEINSAAAAHTHIDRSLLIGASFVESVPAVAVDQLMGLLTTVVDSGDPLAADAVPYTTDPSAPGASRLFDVRAVKVGDAVSVIWRDVTQREHDLVALADSERRYRLLAENVTDVVLHTRRGRIAWVSPSVTEAFGGAPEDYLGMRTMDCVHPEDLSAFLDGVIHVESGGTVVRRGRFRGLSGQYHWVEAHVRQYISAQGQADGEISSLRIVDKQVAAEQELERRARWDSVTGLLNRAELLDRLESRLARGGRRATGLALAYCDVDGFKSVNDQYGHATGDQVLAALAGRIRESVRGDDLVARIGGDEILVVLDGVDSLADAVTVAETVRNEVRLTVVTDEAPIAATISIGVVLARPDEPMDSLLARADQAMYQAKLDGRDRVVAQR